LVVVDGNRIEILRTADSPAENLAIDFAGRPRQALSAAMDE
jgi:hypothetical protein